MELARLCFPPFDFKIKKNNNQYVIFDIIRKKYVSLQPEEWVRQHTIQYLLTNKQYPAPFISVEKTVTINTLIKRFDIVVFNKQGTVDVLVECKAPHIKITQQTFDQIFKYNLELQSKYLMLTNGLKHYFCTVNESPSVMMLTDIPKYEN